jgi:MOSC domain-containing protein YiiM
MKLLAISVAVPRQIEYNRRWIATGIYKEPVSHPVRATVLGLEGDVQVDRENHGGPDKAIYVYTVENYRFWEQEFNKAPFPYGQFGENFTVEELPDEAVHIGDLFRIGPILVQVTQPRVPCFKLGLKMDNPVFVNAFLRSGRVGFYLRVLEEGEVSPGDTITRIRVDEERLTIRDAMLALVKGPRQHEIIDQALRIKALSEAWRNDLEKRRKPE